MCKINENIKTEICNDIKKKFPLIDKNEIEEFYQHLVDVSGPNVDNIRMRYKMTVMIHNVCYFTITKIIPGILLFVLLQYLVNYNE